MKRGTKGDSKYAILFIPNVAKKIVVTDPAGTLEKALERNLLNVQHDRPLPLLDLTFGGVLGNPSNFFNKTRIPRRRKCSHRVCPMRR